MPAILKDFLLVLLLAAVVGGAVEGSIYAKRAFQEGNSSDATLQSERNALDSRQKQTSLLAADLDIARGDLDAQLAKLSDLQASFSPTAYADLVQNERSQIITAVSLTDNFFNKVKASSFNISSSIVAKHQEIDTLIIEWKAEAGLNTFTSNQAAALDLAVIQEYIKELQDLVVGLTPDNSGLTQAQIDAFKQDVADAQKAVDNATNSGNGSSVVTPDTIQQQQDAVDAAQKQVNDLQDQLQNVNNPNNGSGGSGGSDGSSGLSDTSHQGQYTPPPAQTGKPTLIQGDNPY